MNSDEERLLTSFTHPLATGRKVEQAPATALPAMQLILTWEAYGHG
ncbi:MAG: hypothetical protein HQM04_16960 [Magnetococcales bacterium]|nr:hypothetical protein [Magnetococcales bacterium]MBF0116721.1 hypothetical protein [Magnetococcales bacterium]